MVWFGIAGRFHWSFDFEVKDVICIPFFVRNKEVDSDSHLSTKFDSAGKQAKIVHSIIELTNTLNHDGER